MALDDYGYGKGLFDLIKAGQLKDDELDNSEKVKLRSYKIARTGKGVADLLDAGQITQQEIDTDPELKLGLQTYNTQRDLEKTRGVGGFVRGIGESIAGDVESAKQITPQTEAGKALAPTGLKQIDLSAETEPSGIQKAVGERLPQGVIDTLGDIQPTLAVAGETISAGALKLPKARKPSVGEEMIGFTLGVIPQILIARQKIAPAIQKLAAEKGIHPLISERILDLIATELSESARLGIREQLVPPEERYGLGGIVEQLGFAGVGSIAGTAIGQNLARVPGALRNAPDFNQPITVVPRLRGAFERANAILSGTTDQLPPGFTDEALDIVEKDFHKTFPEAFEEVQKQFQAPRAPDTPRAAFEAPTGPAAKKPTTAARTAGITPEEFQAPETRRTPLEQEVGLPRGSEVPEAPKPAPKGTVEPPSEAIAAPPRAEVPETRAEVPVLWRRRIEAHFDRLQKEQGFISEADIERAHLIQEAPDQSLVKSVIDDLVSEGRITPTPNTPITGVGKTLSTNLKQGLDTIKRAARSQTVRTTASFEDPRPVKPPKETFGLEDKHVQALRDREADARVIADIEERFGISVARKAKSEVLDAEKVAAASDEMAAGRTPKDTKLTRAERKADPALENLLNNRAQKNARRAAREAGVSDEDFTAFRKDLGESAISEETASGAISARRERVIRTILDKSTSIDDDTRALLRSELEDVQKSRTAPKTEQAVTKKDIFSDKKIPLGAAEEVVTPSNTKAKTKFAVVDASDLKTSFDEGFPPELQNRLRGTRIASTAQIEEIASKFDAKRLGSSREVGSGSPVVDREGNVLVGNGRTSAIRRVLADDDLPAGDYRDFIKENAEKFGIDPKRVDDLDNPILVRVLEDDVDGPKFIREANQPTAQTLSATEKSLDDARKLSDETLALIRPDDLELDNSPEFTNRFAKEVVGPTEMNAFVDSQGNISAEGKRRVRNAVFARAYDDVDVIENVVESNDQNFKNISKVLFNTSPAFAQTKGGKFGINEKIIDALDQLVQAKKRGIRLDQQLAQRTIGGKEPDELTKSLAMIFDQSKSKPAVLGRFMERLAEAMQNAETAAGQQGLFGGDKINTDDIIEIVLRKVADEGNIGTLKIEGTPKGEAVTGTVGSKQPVRPGKGKPRTRESAAVSEPLEKDFIQAVEDAEGKLGRKLTNSEVQTIENSLAFKEQAEITLPEEHISLEKARMSGTEEDAITILSKTKRPPKGAAVGAFKRTATSAVDTDLLDLPEIVELSQELMGGRMPIIAKRIGRGRDILGFFSPNKGEIKLRADILKDPDLTKRVLAHEVGHLVDWLPDKTLKRGNILGSIASLKKFLKPELVDESGVFKNKEIRAELKKLSAIWRPISEADRTNKEFMKYRNSSRELYADGISALINDPVLLQTEAPTFYKAFDNFLDRKPEVQRLYFEMLDRKASGRAVAESATRLEEMFERGEQAFKAKLEDKTTLSKISESLRIAFIDSFDAVLTEVRKLEKNLPSSKNPRYAIEKSLYSGSEALEHMIQLKAQVLDPLGEAKLSLTDLDKLAFSRRVLGDRGKLANPLGIDKKRAREIIDLMKEELGAEKFGELSDIHDRIYEWRKPIIAKIRNAEMYGEDTIRALEQNTDYVTFNVFKHMNERYGGYVSGVIHGQVGTFDEIASPLTSTVLKDETIIRSVNKNNAIRTTIEFLQENLPHDIVPAKTKLQVIDGKTVQVPAKPTDKNLGLIAYLDKGKVKGFYVEKNIADAFVNNEFESQAFQVAARAFDLLARPFREVFINKNIGFWMFNTMRDNWRAGTQLPNARLANFVPSMVRSYKPAWHFVTRVPDEVISEMSKNNELISIVSNDGLSAFDKQIERELVKFGLVPNKWENMVTKPFLKLFDGMEKLASFLEVQPKVASHLYLRERFPNMPEEEIRHLVTTMGGSPSFLRKGKLYPFYNNTFLFSNAIKEGMRADLKYAAKNPVSFMAKVAFGSAILPKTLMWGAAAGVFGEGVKKIMDGATEYDKTNYHIIPLGLTEDGKSIYLRVPQPEPVRYIGGVYWKLVNHTPGQSFTEVFDLTAGQVPGLNPAFGIIKDSVEFLSGRNPYDAFRQRNVIEDQAFKAGGAEKWKQFFKHLAGEVGANTFVVMNVNNGREASNTLEEIYGIPIAGPLVSRFVKVTDQGVREKERREERQEDKENARAILAAREAAQKVFRGEKLTKEERRAALTKRQSYDNELDRLKGIRRKK